MTNPQDIHNWKLMVGNEKLGQILSSIPSISGGKVIHTALNGAAYVQQIGEGVRENSIQVFCQSQAEKYRVDQLNDAGAFFSYYYNGATYFGFIKDPIITWNTTRPGECYTGSCTMIVDHVIEDI